ncbi:hypothetical protein QQF64_023415 [Cirrhinus molitorella]|uniref:Uncharacterized protein n=1 Tax=Cirrhinus molitorella TaxID=172907 RepID=A0ABR3L8N4_9TELE
MLLCCCLTDSGRWSLMQQHRVSIVSSGLENTFSSPFGCKSLSTCQESERLQDQSRECRTHCQNNPNDCGNLSSRIERRSPGASGNHLVQPLKSQISEAREPLFEDKTLRMILDVELESRRRNDQKQLYNCCQEFAPCFLPTEAQTENDI